MNLDMPSQVITGLVQRGAAAGRNLAWIRRGTLADWQPSDPDTAAIYAHQWDRHRFARLRTVLAGIGNYLADTRTGLDHDFTPDPGYLQVADLATRVRWLPYREKWTRQRIALVKEATDRIFAGDVGPLTETAPAGSRLGYTAYARPLGESQTAPPRPPAPSKPSAPAAPATPAAEPGS